MRDGETDQVAAPRPGILAGWAGILARAIGDIIMPPVCLACREPLASHDALCPECWPRVNFIRPPICDRLGLPMPFDAGARMISAAAAAEPPIYARARAVAHYTGLMREMIGQLKYADRHEARKLMGRWLAGAARDLLDDCDMIVPVPMHPRRLMWRRFNQAGLIAGELARISGRPFEPTVLIRVRATRSQVGLTRNQRLRNLAGAFAVPARRRSLVHGRRVLLVDDVITTGTTLNAAARVLLRAGASEVDAAALALVTPESRIGL